MNPRLRENDAWRHLVIKSGPTPAWLRGDGTDLDVVMSSRSRVARNLRGYPFPHRASKDELKAVEQKVLGAIAKLDPNLEVLRNLSESEVDYLVHCRLVSADFDPAMAHRSVVLDAARHMSLMINEEDHVRLQVITSGWNPRQADTTANRMISKLASIVQFAQCESLGYLTTSPFNAGAATRTSALFHLIGLAKTKRLKKVLDAVRTQRVVVRGLFGERSKAIAAYFQVSMTQRLKADFVGACEYLIREERSARDSLTHDQIYDLCLSAAYYGITQRGISYQTALETLAYIRWAAACQLPGFPDSPNIVDNIFVQLESRTHIDQERASRARADALRPFLESIWQNRATDSSKLQLRP